MPRLIECDPMDSIEVGDLVEALETGGFDPEDEACIASFAPALKRLANNRRFLGDLVIEELKQRCAGQVARNHYSAQVILLHSGSARFTLRANFWPAESDSVVVNSGTRPFFYDVPHDHNFTFLTVGYVGPGYWSDYYEYDYDRTVGFTGETVDLRFVERSRLDEGKVLLYRKHLDVHRQLPPDAMSVSINILATSRANEFYDQYLFDLEESRIVGLANPSGLEALIGAVGRCGGENGRDLIESFAERHPSDRMRFAALRAKADAAPDVDGRIQIYREAAGRSTGFVREMATRAARETEANRGWLEGRLKPVMAA